MSDIAPHLQRIVEERAELADKLGKLGTFIGGKIFNDLPDADQDLLHEQCALMTEYHRVLGVRLARAGVSV